MARKTFALETEPHVAALGDGTELHFLPEIYGDRFLDAYAELQAAQEELGSEKGDTEGLSGDKLRALYAAIRVFLVKIMTEECADRFNRFEVSRDGEVVEAFRTKEEADLFAETTTGTVRVVDRSIQLPTRLLVELMEWCIELYGGGQKRPTGPSKGSSAGSRRTGTSGKASSRSGASTSAAGR
jgi:hypothetical protein